MTFENSNTDGMYSVCTKVLRESKRESDTLFDTLVCIECFERSIRIERTITQGIQAGRIPPTTQKTPTIGGWHIEEDGSSLTHIIVPLSRTQYDYPIV